MHMPNAGTTCKWIVDLLHNSQKKQWLSIEWLIIFKNYSLFLPLEKKVNFAIELLSTDRNHGQNYENMIQVEQKFNFKASL